MKNFKTGLAIALAIALCTVESAVTLHYEA